MVGFLTANLRFGMTSSLYQRERRERGAGEARTPFPPQRPSEFVMPNEPASWRRSEESYLLRNIPKGSIWTKFLK